jgi:hypothetical protein
MSDSNVNTTVTLDTKVKTTELERWGRSVVDMAKTAEKAVTGLTGTISKDLSAALTATEKDVQNLSHAFTDYFKTVTTGAQQAQAPLQAVHTAHTVHAADILKARQAAEDLAKVHVKTASTIKESYGGLVSELSGRFAGLFTVGAIEEFTRRSIMNFAQIQHSMDTIQYSAGGTSEQMESLTKTFEELSQKTGLGLTELQNKFEVFRATSNLSLTPATEMFKVIAEAANDTGTNIDAMGSITSSALNTLKIPTEQVRGLLMGLAAEMGSKELDNFARMVPRLTQDVASWAVGTEATKKSLEGLAAVAAVADETAFGGSKKGFQVLENSMSGMRDFTTAFGRQVSHTFTETMDKTNDTGEAYIAVSKRINQTSNLMFKDHLSEQEVMMRTSIMKNVFGWDGQAGEDQRKFWKAIYEHQDKVREKEDAYRRGMSDAEIQHQRIMKEDLAAINNLKAASE